LQSDPVIFKTTLFFKRNFNKTREILSHILLELKHVKNGFKKLNKDIKYTIDVKKEYINKKYKNE
jgi:hypothetical protein